MLNIAKTKTYFPISASVGIKSNS